MIYKIIKNAIISSFLILSPSTLIYSSNATTFSYNKGEDLMQKKALSQLPNMRNYPVGTIRKKEFLKVIIPIIEKHNNIIMKDRLWLLSKRYRKNWTFMDKEKLNNICNYYNVTYISPIKLNWDELLSKVDIIPTHFVVIQAATESGWGTSDLAQKNNNLFGMKCSHKCIHKKGTIKGYAAYLSIDASVNAYLKNLNTNDAYRALRDSRVQQRKKQNSLNTSILIDHLKNYSHLGRKYNRYLQQLLLNNKDLITNIQQNI